MATTGETSEKPLDTSNSLNGDTTISLQYSGASEELSSSGENASIHNNSKTTSASTAQTIVQDFSDDLDEHVTPVSLAQAVKTEHHEHGLSDDEFPKTLTTLETVKKTVQSNEGSDEIEICPIEADDDDDFEEETILLEVYNADEPEKDVKDVVSMQLDELGTDVEKSKPPKIKQVPVAAEEKVRKERKQKFNILSNKIIRKGGQVKKDGATKMVKTKNPSKASTVNDTVTITPIKPIPLHSAGTIEIPRELINAPDLDIVSTPIIINHVKNPKAGTDNLIAILEGHDEPSLNPADTVEHYELSLSGENGHSPTKALTKEEECEIAMQQMLSLPLKKKGRPRLEPNVKAARTGKSKKVKNAELVNSLVSEWSDNEAKAEEEETEILIEINNENGVAEINIPTQKKRKAEVAPVQPTFKRSRIIKKKIIWDPDAPETAINYASLAHTSGAGPVKKKVKKAAPVAKSAETTTITTTTTAVESVPEPSLSGAQKKKKTSEVEKLLGDEGAANMLNSLSQENSNKIDRVSPGKSSSRTKGNKVDATEPVASPAKTKLIKPKEVKEPIPNKTANSANKKGVAAKSTGVGKKRGAKKAAESWDYIYKSRPDDCMIIRRRSNSSYSSTASVNRSSIDLASAPPIIDSASETIETPDSGPPAKKSRNSKDKGFEFAKPTPKTKRLNSNEAKLQIGNGEDIGKPTTSNECEAEESAVMTALAKPKEEKMNETVGKGQLPMQLENDNPKDTFTQIVFRRFENFVHILLKPLTTNTTSVSNTLLTTQMLKEIELALHSVESAKPCKLVLMTSENDVFCSGVDYSSLIQPTAAERRTAALELSKKLSHFIQTLAAFKKPLAAAVKGHVSGLGVRILPLFDFVWAQNDSSFAANDRELGEIVEGSAIFSTTNKLSPNGKANLLYLHEVLNAEKAKECNLITQELNWVDIDQTVLIECEKLATKSAQILEVTRLMHQHDFIPKLKESLKIEQKHLLQQWIKSDFLDKLKAHLNQ